MKILVSISTYGEKNNEYLNRVIDEYKSYKNHDIDIIVHGTHALSRNDITFVKYENPKTTVYFHREEFVKKQNEYDVFIFSENDMLIHEETIDLYLEQDKKLPIDYALGFIRFENTPENTKYLIDLWINVPAYDYLKNKRLEVQDNSYFSITNPHQACYVLTKEKLKFVISNSDYLIDGSGVGLETASSGIFTDWYLGTGVIKKIIPYSKEKIQKCFIEHLPGNHCNHPGINAETPPEKFKRTCLTEQQLFQNLNL